MSVSSMSTPSGGDNLVGAIVVVLLVHLWRSSRWKSNSQMGGNGAPTSYSPWRRHLVCIQIDLDSCRGSLVLCASCAARGCHGVVINYSSILMSNMQHKLLKKSLEPVWIYSINSVVGQTKYVSCSPRRALCNGGIKLDIWKTSNYRSVYCTSLTGVACQFWCGQQLWVLCHVLLHRYT